MAKRSKPRTKIDLTMDDDAQCWRYGSAVEALYANVDLLARLIRHGEDILNQAKSAAACPEVLPAEGGD